MRSMTSEVMVSGHGAAHDDSMTDITATPKAPTKPRHDRHDCEHRLRVVLRLNALNSIVFGLVLATVPGRIDELLDTGHPGWIRVVGLGLVPFGAFCAWLSTTSSTTLRRITPQVVAGDVAWVGASAATVLLGWYSGVGVVAVLAMAAIVDVFAVLQWSAWRRLRTMP
jgi:hypothetical protein